MCTRHDNKCVFIFLVSKKSSHSNLRTQRRHHRAPSNEAPHLTVRRNHISSSSNIFMSSSSSVFKRETLSRDYEHSSMFERAHFFEYSVDAETTLHPQSKRHVHRVSKRSNLY